MDSFTCNVKGGEWCGNRIWNIQEDMEYASINIAHRMWERTRGKCAIRWKIWEIGIRCWVQDIQYVSNAA